MGNLITIIMRKLLHKKESEQEIAKIKKDIVRKVKQTNTAIKATNKMLYNKSTTYFIAKAIGALND